MSRFRFRELRVDNYRCFEAFTFPLEEDGTVLFAENSGGKTALLTALAMGIAVFQKGSPKTAKLRCRANERTARNPLPPFVSIRVAWLRSTLGRGQ